MTSSDAQIILDLIEYATDGNWQNTVRNLEEMGYNGGEVVAATEVLAKLARRTNPLSLSDF